MFCRKLQSNLPTIDTGETDDDMKLGLRQNRDRNILTYNSHCKTLGDLAPGQSVRIQDPVTKKWTPAVVLQNEAEPRSYLLDSGGVTYRRNRKHIRTTGETFTTNNDDIEEEELPIMIPLNAPTIQPASPNNKQAPSVQNNDVPNASGTSTTNSNQPTNCGTLPSSAVPNASGATTNVNKPTSCSYTTRRGCAINAPVRLDL